MGEDRSTPSTTIGPAGKHNVAAEHDHVPAIPRRFRSRRRVREPRRWFRRLVVGLLVLAVGCPVVAFVAGWLAFPAPTPVVSPAGRAMRVPLPVRHAVLAAEDRSFYSNPGFSVSGIGRAVWNQLTGGSGGGSTITQQYVKITTGHDQHTIWRKYKEVIAAAKISRRYPKDQILRDYLNAVYLGRGAYGMPAAAQAYFGEGVDRLNLAQGALLAALIQAPSRLDPAVNPGEARARWNYVLDGMVAEHWLSPARRASLVFPATLPPGHHP
jgi:hypothetical protein